MVADDGVTAFMIPWAQAGDFYLDVMDVMLIVFGCFWAERSESEQVNPTTRLTAPIVRIWSHSVMRLLPLCLLANEILWNCLRGFLRHWDPEIDTSGKRRGVLRPNTSTYKQCSVSIEADFHKFEWYNMWLICSCKVQGNKLVLNESHCPDDSRASLGFMGFAYMSGHLHV